MYSAVRSPGRMPGMKPPYHLDADAGRARRRARRRDAGEPRLYRGRLQQVPPGGRLGAMLKFVRDIMHTGSEIPLATNGQTISPHPSSRLQLVSRNPPGMERACRAGAM
jgi:hypothetical protein